MAHDVWRMTMEAFDVMFSGKSVYLRVPGRRADVTTRDPTLFLRVCGSLVVVSGGYSPFF